MVRGGKALLLIFVIFTLIFSSLVYADSDETGLVDVPQVGSRNAGGFDASKSYSWLFDKVSNATFDIDIRALSDLALIQGNNANIAGLLEALRDKEDVTNGCWPRGGCKVKDTALATLALASAGQDVTKEVEWLKKSRVPGLSGGEWWIVVKSSGNGTCAFSYPGGTKTFNIQDEKVKTQSGGFTSGQYYINLNELSSTLRNTLQPEITVSCDASLTNPILTLIYKPNANTFFIQRSDPGSNLQFKVANACYGLQVPTSTCNYDSTVYATWALDEIGIITNDPSLSLENIGTHIYLETQALNKRNDPIALGLLNRILIKSSNAAPSFISDLVKLQRADGSWNGDIIATSIASFGLIGSNENEVVTKSINYLTSKVGNDGSWSGSVEATSWALIALHGGDLSRIVVSNGNVDVTGAEICGNGIDDDLDGADDCAEAECVNNPICQCVNNIQDGDETGVDCGGTCAACLEEALVEEQFEELGEEIIDEEESLEGEEEDGSLWWLWLIIILLLLGGGAFFYIKYIKTGKVDLAHLFKKKPKGPTFEEFRRQAEFKPAQQSQRPAAQQSKPAPRPMQGKPSTFSRSKSREDEELERSIKEAEKLLKG